MTTQCSKNEIIKDLRQILVANLSSVVAGKRVLLFGQAAASDTVIDFLSEAGVAAIQPISFPLAATDKVSAIYYCQNKQLQYPEENLKDILLQADPDGDALIYAGSAVNVDNVDGRRVIGYRQPQWSEAERKRIQTVITKGQKGYNPVYIECSSIDSEDVLINFCVERAPCVISGDTKEQIAMGADYVYVITSETDCCTLRMILASLSQCCTGVRIAALTTGLPITVYGYFADIEKTAIFPPVEAIVGYRKVDNKMFAPGALVPTCECVDVRCVEKAVENIVNNLSSYCGYRGAFGVDGVFSDKGFTVHEINPRVCAGFSLMSRLLENELPLGLIDMLIRENVDGLDEMLLCLREMMSVLDYVPELKLWNHPSLEQRLRECVPKDDSEGIAKWKSTVRSEALRECIPLVDFIPGIGG
jgi:hypothetical protein